MPASLLASFDRNSGAASPAPSTGSASGTTKRKRPDMPAYTPSAQPASTNAGHELLSQAKHAVDYLKDRTPRVERTFDEIISYLSLQHGDPEQLRHFKKILQAGMLPITYRSAGRGGAGSYKYKPKLPIENEEDLKSYLQKAPSSIGVRMEDLKDGWEKCAEDLDKMEQRHELLIIRDKKGTIKTVWQDDSTLAQSVAAEFQRQWHMQALPNDDQDLREKLEAAGLKPTTAPREMKKTNGTQKKRRNNKTRGKTTNAHMTGVLKDYSHKRYENA